MSRRMWEAMKTKTGETRVVETKEGREKETRRKETEEGRKEEKEKTKKEENNGSKKGARGMRNVRWWRRDSKIREESKKANTRTLS